MGNLRAVLSVSLLSLAACGDDGGSAKPDAPVIHLDAAVDAAPDTPPLPDAPSYDLTCHGNAAPTTADPTVTVSGTAQVVSGMNLAPANNVSLEAHSVVGGATLDTDGPTGAAGTWTLGPITAGVPVDAYIRATRSGSGGERTTLVYPPQPLRTNQTMVPVLMISDTQLNGLLSLVGMHQDADKGLLGIAVVDCAGMPINGATVSAKQGNTDVGQPFDIGQFSAQFAGTWFVLNVPPGDTVVNARYNNTDFRAHTVSSAAMTATTTVVRPGF